MAILSPDHLSSTAGEISLLLCAEDAASFDEDAAAVDGKSCDVSPECIEELIAVEADYVLGDDYLSRYLSRELDATARQDAVTWIIKVTGFYRFSPVTAYLAVSYLDRFLSVNNLPSPVNGKHGSGGGGWPMQLLSVACVAVAAKMEEIQVPFFRDLQILDPGFIFEPKTVQRMELLLISSLRWRLRIVTPFVFLDHLLSFAAAECGRSLLSQAAVLVVKSLRVIDFLRFRPSELAAAAVVVVCAVANGGDVSSSWFNELVKKEAVIRCRQLMEEYLIDACRFSFPAKPSSAEPWPPESPVGVLDAAAHGSRDSQISTLSQLETPPPPETKRRRLFCTESIATSGSQW